MKAPPKKTGADPASRKRKRSVTEEEPGIILLYYLCRVCRIWVFWSSEPYKCYRNNSP